MTEPSRVDPKAISPSDTPDAVAPQVNESSLPDLAGMWGLLDEAWEKCGCEPDAEAGWPRFYSDPVWILNGRFIEQDPESLAYRRQFSEHVASLGPRRVCDFGGGYGTLARMIGRLCPDAEVHIVEPHPHHEAVTLLEENRNVSYVPELVGKYDVIIATDVFEHVPDPLALVEKTARHLSTGGEYFIANCFWPVIRCHLPCTFHFRWSWDAAMSAMNLQPSVIVAYGRAYRRVGPVTISAARAIERLSKRWFPVIEHSPARIRARIARLLFGAWP